MAELTPYQERLQEVLEGLRARGGVVAPWMNSVISSVDLRSLWTSGAWIDPHFRITPETTSETLRSPPR